MKRFESHPDVLYEREMLILRILSTIHEVFRTVMPTKNKTLINATESCWKQVSVILRVFSQDWVVLAYSGDLPMFVFGTVACSSQYHQFYCISSVVYTSRLYTLGALSKLCQILHNYCSFLTRWFPHLFFCAFAELKLSPVLLCHILTSKLP